MAWPWLPVELIARILAQLPPSRSSEDSVHALVRCSEVNTAFRKVATEPTLWQPHYRIRYSHSNSSAESQRMIVTDGNWCRMYALRQRLDQRGLRMLDDIVHHTGGVRLRHKHALALAQELHFDVWDVLEREKDREIPPEFWQGTYQDRAPLQTVGLTRTYWAQAMLGAVTRHEAIKSWGTLKADSTQPVSFEEAFNGLSTFFGSSMRDIKMLVDVIAYNYLVARLPNDKECLSGRGTEEDLRRLSLGICEYMRDTGFGPADESHFHNLLNHFPHFFLSPDLRKNSLPISLVYTFVALARRAGLDAAPINFPHRVLARVALPNSSTHIFVSVFDSLQPGSPLELRTMPIEEGSELTKPARTADMLLRATHNIGASLQVLDHTVLDTMRANDIASAVYALRAARAVLSEPMVDPERLLGLMDRYHPLDLVAVAKDAIGPFLSPPNRVVLEEKIEETLDVHDAADRDRHLRSTCGAEIQFFVGQVFSHKRYGYRAAVIGWDPVCSAGEEWIKQMRVDRLPRGKDQPFYSVLNMAGSQHYVAEENIVPTELTRELFGTLSANYPNLGMFFQAAEFKAGKGRLVLSPQQQLVYPEDDAAGAEWLQDEFTVGEGSENE